MKAYINKAELRALTNGEHQNPHHILGRHKYLESFYINAYKPNATKVEVINAGTGESYEMEKIDEAGFFTLMVGEAFDYKFKMTGYNGDVWEYADAYAFDHVMGELDLYLFGQGTHYDIYEKLGAHKMTVDGTEGVCFAVWAPNAKRVSVVGDFSSWDGRVYPMRMLGQSGIYELFIPGLSVGDKYKYEIKTQENYILEKSDPYGNASELRPNTASVVADLNTYKWNDEKWYKEIEQKDVYNQPISIYEVHLGSWKRGATGTGFLNYRELAHELGKYCEEMGYTHIELMPIAEHPFDGSWGYQVTGYFAPTSRFGTPDDFMYFVDYLHQKGIGVIVDWVPAHFPKDGHGLIKFDGSAMYEHEDPKQGEHPHWGTMIFNFGRHEVKNFFISNALFWLEKFHIDGLRVDAVASMLYLDYGKSDGEWIPNPHGGRENLEAVEFFKHLNSILHQKHPKVLMFAEESTSWPGVSRPSEYGGLGFDMKWNMGWMNDFLRYIEKDPIHRKYHHHDLTFSMIYAYTENFVLVLSHDEVVHGKGSMIDKMPGDYWQKFANLRAAYGFMYTHPGKKLNFMGSEFAQFDEWSEAKSLDWHLLEFDKHKQIQDYVKTLNKLYVSEPALWKDDFTSNGFEWINCNDSENSIVAYVRKTDDVNDTIIVVANFTPVPRTLHKVGVPYEGKYKEILNSDSPIFGGSGVVNMKAIQTVAETYDGRPQNIGIKVPPLGVTVLKYQGK